MKNRDMDELSIIRQKLWDEGFSLVQCKTTGALTVRSYEGKEILEGLNLEQTSLFADLARENYSLNEKEILEIFKKEMKYANKGID